MACSADRRLSARHRPPTGPHQPVRRALRLAPVLCVVLALLPTWRLAGREAGRWPGSPLRAGLRSSQGHERTEAAWARITPVPRRTGTRARDKVTTCAAIERTGAGIPRALATRRTPTLVAARSALAARPPAVRPGAWPPPWRRRRQAGRPRRRREAPAATAAALLYRILTFKIGTSMTWIACPSWQQHRDLHHATASVLSRRIRPVRRA